MTRRVCPACQRRWAGLVADDCPICAGTGTLDLGRAAVQTKSAEAASLAAELILETTARQDLAATSTQHAPPIDVARRHLTEAVDKMRRAGLLARTPEPSPTTVRGPFNRDQAERRALAISGAARSDLYLLHRPALELQPDDRPLAAGGIPGFSAAGYVAHHVRVADPRYPFGPSTRDVWTGRYATHRAAKALATSVQPSLFGDTP